MSNNSIAGVKYKRGTRWKNFMGMDLEVMGTIDGYIMLKYVGNREHEPFVKHESIMPQFLKYIEAKKIKL